MLEQVGSIALFTDFGPYDHYLEQMMAVLCSDLPHLPTYNLLSSAPSFNPNASAYLLASLLNTLPAGSLVLAVVDPGVGSDRKILIVDTDEHVLIWPDNGLLSIAAKTFTGSRVRTIGWRPEHMSMSFHGRDLFAPVAVRLLTGLDIDLLDCPSESICGWWWVCDLDEIIYVDHYGNLITGFRFPLHACIKVSYKGQQIECATTFSDVGVGEVFFYRNSSGLVEIAQNQGSAAKVFDGHLGDKVEIEFGA
jgi:hypothetical protein